VPPLSHLTTYTPSKSNLHLDNSLPTAVSEPALYRLLTFQMPNGRFPYITFIVRKDQSKPKILRMVHNMVVFEAEQLLAPRPTPKLGDHPLSAVCHCLFYILTRPFKLESIRNLRTRRGVVTGTDLSYLQLTHNLIILNVTAIIMKQLNC